MGFQIASYSTLLERQIEYDNDHHTLIVGHRIVPLSPKE